MKSRIRTLSKCLIGVFFCASALFANGGKYITFRYIKDSDGSWPSMSGVYQYSYWTSDAMGDISLPGTSVSESIEMMGISVTFDISLLPVNWQLMTSHNMVNLTVLNPNNGETNTFTGTLTFTWDAQLFEDDYTLPVELISFTVSTDDEVVLLNWETASETDNAGYIIYRSEEFNGDFQPINNALIQGVGNTSSAQEYSFTDYNVQAGETYYYKLESLDINGDNYLFGPVAIAVGESELDLPEDYTLSQNYPNPFNPVTTIQYSLPEVSTVKMSVYNIQGRLVDRLVNQSQDAGIYTVQWPGVHENGATYPSGVYFYELVTDSYRDIKKMFFVK